MSSSLRILFHLPTRSRPDKAREAIQNIIDNVEDDNYLILVSLDEDDATMHDFKFIHRKVLIHWGKSNNKIHACNRSIHLIKDWDILVASSDDMRFQVKGFDNVIRESFNKEVETLYTGNQKWNELNQFLHFNDGNQCANVCTLSIMGREYYERDGYVYHPDYHYLWCDCESTDVAKQRGCYKYMGNDNIIFRHLHPAWGLAPMDGQYLKQDNHMTSAKDKETYERRKANGFN
jgi:hypothetical protein